MPVNEWKPGSMENHAVKQRGIRSKGRENTRKPPLQTLENRRLLAAGTPMTSSVSPEVPVVEAYWARAVPPAALMQTSAVEPEGGARPADADTTTGQLDIEFVPGLDLRSNPAAMAAVERAVAQWESVLLDPITVTIEIDFGPTPSGVLGFAIPTQVVAPYAEVRAALVADGLPESDDSILTRLPAVDALEFALPVGTQFEGNVALSKANAKSIGLRTEELDDQFGAADGGIVMSQSIGFDFNRADGIESNQVDFETVLVHEIGHILGFISSTDQLQGATPPGTIAPTTLDLFRFRSLEGVDNPRTPAAFESVRRELRRATPAVTDFIIQDGWDLPRVEYPVETGVRSNVVPGSLPTDPSPEDFAFQASHWQDSDLFGTTIGVMTPTIPPQTIIPISNVDLRALDLIGYDILAPNVAVEVPELNDDTVSLVGENQVVIDVLANDRTGDVPFQLSTFQIVEPPVVGQVAFDASSGLLVYSVPESSGDDLDAFTYTIANDQGIVGKPAVVSVSVSGLGQSPVAIDDLVLTRQDQSALFNPLANDVDDGQLRLADLTVVSGPTFGSLTVENDLFRYTPDAGFEGADSITYRIRDTDGFESEAVISITVGSTLIPPVIPGPTLSLAQRADVNGDERVTALDALLTINYLNDSPLSSSADDSAVQRLDVSGDGFVSAVDALMIINLLNQPEVHGEATRDLGRDSSSRATALDDADHRTRYGEDAGLF
ncbi:MAG: NF038122 family metalloprotease [Planctomycetota bacterium]